jgi:hypothetical protein
MNIHKFGHVYFGPPLGLPAAPSEKRRNFAQIMGLT